MKNTSRLSEVKNGLVRIAVAYTGRFQKDDQPFEITAQDLEQIAANLNRREAPIDYEHLSGGTAPPGWSKAAGWIKRADAIAPLASLSAKALADSGQESLARPGASATGSAFRGAYPRPRAGALATASAEGPKALWAWAELTPACLAAVRQKEFRYFSPEIHWNERDEQGRAIGTRLAAGAITNRPFLKDLPPIEISEADYPALLESVALSEALRAGLCATVSEGCRCEGKAAASTARKLMDAGQVHVPAEINSPKKENTVKQFTLKKLADGEHAGRIGVFDGDEMVGLCDPLDADADNSDGYNSGSDANAENGDDTNNNTEDNAGDNTQQQMRERRSLSEAVRDIVSDGQINLALAEQRAARGELTMSGFLRAQKIQRLVEDAVKAGKVLPKQRASLFAMALADFANAEAFVMSAQPVVDLRARGVSGDGAATAKEELDQAVSAYMTEHGCDRVKALTDVSRRNPELWERHKRECGAAALEMARVQ